MNSDEYEALLRRLGFTTSGRGGRLRHPANPPAVYFSRQRDGSVSFSTPRKLRARFATGLWTLLPARQHTGLRQRVALQPVAGREEQALRSLLDDALDLREAQEGAEQLRVERRRDLAAAERSRLLLARLGQGDYRAAVERFEQRCRLTGLQDRRHLRASHIKPWSQSDDREKLDGNNGLLLSPHLQQLFERGHISFADAGDLLVSRHLNPAVLASWRIVLPANVGAFRPEQCVYLAWHREQVFEHPDGGRRELPKP